MRLELHVADVVDDHKIKMDAMRLNIRNIRKYAIHTKAWYHYAVGSIVTLVALWSHFFCIEMFYIVSMYGLIRCSRELYLVQWELYMYELYVYFFSNNIWSLMYFGFNVMMNFY